MPRREVLLHLAGRAQASPGQEIKSWHCRYLSDIVAETFDYCVYGVEDEREKFAVGFGGQVGV